jgi:hypothetical protein
VGEIARRVGEPIHRVEYVIRSRGITPRGIAGNARVFSAEAVQRIEQELRIIQAARNAGRKRQSNMDCRGAKEESA